MGPGQEAGDPQFLLGTDSLGRDVFSRTIYGARVSMVVGLIPTLIILVIGGVDRPDGRAIAAARVDNLLMRFDRHHLRVPRPAVLHHRDGCAARDADRAGDERLAAAVRGACHRQLGRRSARLVRGQVLSLKQKEFVEAGRMIGAPSTPHHVQPPAAEHPRASIIVYTAFRIPALIITEAILGYLGLGLRPATDPDGVLHHQLGLADAGRADGDQRAAWLLLAPAICVALVVLAFNYLGDGLRDALDPRMAGTE